MQENHVTEKGEALHKIITDDEEEELNLLQFASFEALLQRFLPCFIRLSKTSTLGSLNIDLELCGPASERYVLQTFINGLC